MMIIGHILHNNKVYERVAPILQPEYFAVAVHGRIYEACGKLINAGKQADPRSLKLYFEADDELAAIGGTPYLGKLAASVVTIINSTSYAETIRECWVRRRLIDIGQQTVDSAYEFDLDVSADEQVDTFQTELAKLSDDGNRAFRSVSLGDAVQEALDRAADAEARGTRINGTRTGFHGIDRILGGLQPGVYILGGRTSMGKTAAARSIAHNVAHAAALGEPNSGPVLYFSMEMTAVQMGYAIVGPEVGITASDLMVGAVSSHGDSGEKWAQLLEAQARLAELPLVFDDRPGLSVPQIHAAAKRFKRQHRGLALIVIDLLGYVTGPDTRDNRADKIHMIMVGLKSIAAEMQAPLLVLHQLSRETEKREDHRPTLSDLRDSGAIEQDADVVMFVYREHYYLQRSRPTKRDKESHEAFAAREADWYTDCQRCENIGEIIIEKNRLTGPIGTVKLLWDGKFATFKNLHDDGQGRFL